MTNLRAEFEDWLTTTQFFKKRNPILRTFIDGSYADYRVNARWQAYQAGHAAAVPEGWQVVPIEPTEEMLQETERIVCNDSGKQTDRTRLATTEYTAMLAAAPTPTKE